MAAIGKLPQCESDTDVLTFLAVHGINSCAKYVAFEDHGYEKDYCHVSALHAAKTMGGRRIHGWALWQFNGYVLAEFHSVWEKTNGDIVDVTPPKYDKFRVLFVPDPNLSIYNHGTHQALYCDRTSISASEYWFQGKLQTSSEWAIPNDTPDLVRYCGKLGLPDTLIG